MIASIFYDLRFVIVQSQIYNLALCNDIQQIYQFYKTYFEKFDGKHLKGKIGIFYSFYIYKRFLLIRSTVSFCKWDEVVINNIKYDVE